MSGSSILVDADALVALIKQDDPLHRESLAIADNLTKNNLATIVLVPTVLEAATALSRGAKRPDLAHRLLSDYSELEFPTLPAHIFKELSSRYNPKTSAKNTPFDYFLLSFAHLEKINTIFSFDPFYEKHGLILAKKLFNSKR